MLHYISAAEEAALKDATATSFEMNELNCQGKSRASIFRPLEWGDSHVGSGVG
jgi:hypothetical protein